MKIVTMTILAVDDEFLGIAEVAAYQTEKMQEKENTEKDRLQNTKYILVIED